MSGAESQIVAVNPATGHTTAFSFSGVQEGLPGDASIPLWTSEDGYTYSTETLAEANAE